MVDSSLAAMNQFSAKSTEYSHRGLEGIGTAEPLIKRQDVGVQHFVSASYYNFQLQQKLRQFLFSSCSIAFSDDFHGAPLNSARISFR
jgi:hypothetical protein